MPTVFPNILRSSRFRILKIVMSFAVSSCAAIASEPPMLDLTRTGPDPTRIDYDSLLVLRGEHALVTAGSLTEQPFVSKSVVFDHADLADPSQWVYRLHSYLAYHDGKYWALWSHGRIVEDHPTQHLRYATSPDGLHWSDAGIVAGPPTRDGFRYIARGLWVRDGKLIALGSLDEAYQEGRVRFFGPSLALHAFEWDPTREVWIPQGAIADQAINNFPPAKLPDGRWGIICRGPDYRRNVFMLSGGVDAIDSWEKSPIVTEAPADGFRPEEPNWWSLPDGRLVGVFRDNSRSGRFYRAFSADNGRTWSTPTKTNFPDATAKFFCLRTSRGFYVLISNANPASRNPLCLSVSEDGVTFTAMAQLPIPVSPEGGAFDADHTSGSVQYPHAIEQDGAVFVSYSRYKTAIEVIKISLDEIERLRR